MYLAELTIRNFRQIGSAEPGFGITLGPGVTALVGENDSGKTAVIDAIRYVLLTRDVDYQRVEMDDFHIRDDGSVADEITLRCRLSNLSERESGAFVEYLTWNSESSDLYVYWQARRLPGNGVSKRLAEVTVRTGPAGEGPTLDPLTRQLLAGAYLRPLRDAEREMASGRGSRLAQVLGQFPGVAAGESFDAWKSANGAFPPEELSLAGMGEYLRHLVNQHPAVVKAETSLNSNYLAELALDGDGLHGKIQFVEGGTERARLRQILERLELGLLKSQEGSSRGRFGLGSNNLLYMACELLLLGKESEALPLLLIEEPEAHLHPQRQLRLMEFLTAAASAVVPDARPVQVIVTTHSPNLSSKVSVEGLVLIDRQRGYSLSSGETALDKSDYRFLQRFLDTTKANLFFARGIIIVEGDAEAILVPCLASLLGKSLTDHGVSIVNVGGTGLRRYARVLQRSDPSSGEPSIAVACVADMDVMPDCAPVILDLVQDDEDAAWSSPRRRWKVERDFGLDIGDRVHALQARRASLRAGDSANVRTFVSDHWTLEYDLAHAGLAEEVFVASILAKYDDPLNLEKKTRTELVTMARGEFSELRSAAGDSHEELCTRIYRVFARESVSKAVAAQYLVETLIEKSTGQPTYGETLRGLLPRYLIDAIEFATTAAGVAAIGLSAEEVPDGKA